LTLYSCFKEEGKGRVEGQGGRGKKGKGREGNEGR